MTQRLSTAAHTRQDRPRPTFRIPAFGRFDLPVVFQPVEAKRYAAKLSLEISFANAADARRAASVARDAFRTARARREANGIWESKVSTDFELVSLPGDEAGPDDDLVSALTSNVPS